MKLLYKGILQWPIVEITFPDIFDQKLLESSKYDHKYLKNDQKVLFFEQIVLLQGFRVIATRQNFILAFFFIYANSVGSIFR